MEITEPEPLKLITLSITVVLFLTLSIKFLTKDDYEF